MWSKAEGMLVYNNSDGQLFNYGDGKLPPEQGWRYTHCQSGFCQLSKNDDQSLRLSWGKISPMCIKINFAREGHHFWTRFELQPFMWSEGRPVYKNPDEFEYLMVAENKSTWGLFKTKSRTTTIREIMSIPPEASSGRATLSPLEKEAGPSVKLQVSNWRWV